MFIGTVLLATVAPMYLHGRDAPLTRHGDETMRQRERVRATPKGHGALDGRHGTSPQHMSALSSVVVVGASQTVLCHAYACLMLR